MIFTVGAIKIYEDYIDEDENPRKLGRDEGDHIGGSVWEEKDAAQAYLDATNQGDRYKVYGVLADWNTDVEENEDTSWGNLLVSSTLVKLD